MKKTRDELFDLLTAAFNLPEDARRSALPGPGGHVYIEARMPRTSDGRYPLFAALSPSSLIVRFTPIKADGLPWLADVSLVLGDMSGTSITLASAYDDDPEVAIAEVRQKFEQWVECWMALIG